VTGARALLSLEEGSQAAKKPWYKRATMLGTRHPALLLLSFIAFALSSSFASAQTPGGAPPSDAQSRPLIPASPPPSSPPPAPSPQPAAAPPPLDQGPLFPASATTPAPAPLPPPPLATSIINPRQDQQQLAQQGRERPTDGNIGDDPHDVYSEDWWGRARPVLELHGYFRTRGYVFHNFFLGRVDPGGDYTGYHTAGSHDQLWAPPLDQSFTGANKSTYNLALCGPYDTPAGGAGGQPGQPCYDKTQSSANLRFRIEPEIVISDNLRIVSQLDLLNNLVLGSTPDAYAVQPANGQNSTTGYTSAGFNGYAPAAAFSTTQGSPTVGINSYQNAVNVNRVWAEYMTPVGQIRFGRMPNQWGLGMVANAGDGIDSDYQSTVDRIMFVTGIKSWDLYFGGAWDFPASGPTNSTPFDVYGGQPVNTCNLCNVGEWVLFAVHRTNPELQKLKLAHGNVVINGGLETTYRRQYIDVNSGYTPLTIESANTTADQDLGNGLIRRDAYAFIPDAWLQALWGKLRIEGEFAAILGDIGTLPGMSNYEQNPYMVREFGLVTETEYRAIEDKLHLGFGFGWASGDQWVQGLNPGKTGLQPELNNNIGPIETFRFHPDYRIDLIFFRNILTRVEGAYYFRPSVDYDLIRQPNGQKFGGGLAIIWSRASAQEQDAGHARDLGIELDFRIYYQAKDGSLNDDPTKIGGFFSMLQYGVFFPLGGLNYLSGTVSENATTQGAGGQSLGVSAAQTVQLFLGVAF
jgi:uncharacterized protein (TIGR04551 family)